MAWPRNERKQDKAKCLDLWKRNGLAAMAETIAADVRVKRGTQKWQEGYIEAPLVYLRGKRWEDGVEPEAPKAAAITVAGESIEAYNDRMARAAEADKGRAVAPPKDLLALARAAVKVAA